MKKSDHERAKHVQFLSIRKLSIMVISNLRMYHCLQHEENTSSLRVSKIGDSEANLLIEFHAQTSKVRFDSA